MVSSVRPLLKNHLIRAAIIGCGKITQRLVLPCVINDRNTRISALVDSDLSLARKTARQFGLSESLALADWEKVVKRDDVDAVFIMTPNYLHAPISIASCENKKHVLVAKPMSLNLKEADSMITASRKNKVFLMVDQTLRFDPFHEAARSVLEKKSLGQIHLVRGRLGHAGPEYWNPKANWFIKKNLSGGGTFIDGGVHMLDLMLWLSAKKVKSVFASMVNVEKKLPVEDSASCLLKFTDGALGVVETSWCTRPYEVTASLYGKNGRLEISSGTEKFLRVFYADKLISLSVLKKSVYVSPYHYFSKCIRENKAPFVTGEQAKDSLAVILAAYESHRRKRWVDIGECFK